MYAQKQKKMFPGAKSSRAIKSGVYWSILTAFVDVPSDRYAIETRGDQVQWTSKTSLNN